MLELPSNRGTASNSKVITPAPQLKARRRLFSSYGGKMPFLAHRRYPIPIPPQAASGQSTLRALK